MSRSDELHEAARELREAQERLDAVLQAQRERDPNSVSLRDSFWLAMTKRATEKKTKAAETKADAEAVTEAGRDAFRRLLGLADDENTDNNNN